MSYYPFQKVLFASDWVVGQSGRERKCRGEVERELCVDIILRQ